MENLVLKLGLGLKSSLFCLFCFSSLFYNTKAKQCFQIGSVMTGSLGTVADLLLMWTRGPVALQLP